MNIHYASEPTINTFCLDDSSPWFPENRHFCICHHPCNCIPDCRFKIVDSWYSGKKIYYGASSVILTCRCNNIMTTISRQRLFKIFVWDPHHIIRYDKATRSLNDVFNCLQDKQYMSIYSQWTAVPFLYKIQSLNGISNSPGFRMWLYKE